MKDNPEVAKAINALRSDVKGVSIHSVHKKYCVKKEDEQSSSDPDKKTGSKSASGQGGGNTLKEAPEQGDDLSTEDTDDSFLDSRRMVEVSGQTG